MLLTKTQKIHLAASKDPGRYSMHGILYREGQLCATNGRILAIVPVTEDEEDEGGIIPAPLVKAALMTPKKVESRVTTLASDANGRSTATAVTKQGILTEPTIEGEFPRVDGVVPDLPKSSRCVVGLNASLLFDLARAIGAEENQVYLELDPEKLEECRKKGSSYSSAVRVYSPENEAAIGVIMPLVGEGGVR